jgi:hypothetical protein
LFDCTTDSKTSQKNIIEIFMNHQEAQNTHIVVRKLMGCSLYNKNNATETEMI